MTSSAESGAGPARLLTAEEWREFQSIPEQGYSHRHWIEARMRERMAEAWDEGVIAGFNRQNSTVWDLNPYRVLPPEGGDQ